MPGATPAATFVTNVIATLPPPGIVKLPHEGVGDAATGFNVVGRVEPPPSTIDDVLAKVMLGFAGKVSATTALDAGLLPAAFDTVIVYVAVPPAGTMGVDVDLVTVRTGKHALELPEPGICPAPRLTIWKPPEEDVEP